MEKLEKSCCDRKPQIVFIELTNFKTGAIPVELQELFDYLEHYESQIVIVGMISGANPATYVIPTDAKITKLIKLPATFYEMTEVVALHYSR